MKQLAEKLVMTADLLKYSPHSEITDVNWGFCVNICNLLSMPFFFYLPPIHSSLLQGHPLPESPEVFFPTRGLAPSHITMAFNYLSSSLPSPATPALAYFTSDTGLPAFLQIQQACPYPRVLHWLYSDWKRSSSGRPLASFSLLFQVFVQISPSQCIWLDNCV